MIPGGKFLGMALVSMQKALSLVQEQVAGQRGVFGALDPPARLRHIANRQIRPKHLRPRSGMAGVPLQDDELLCKATLTGRDLLQLEEEEEEERRRWQGQKLSLVGAGGGEFR